jgi:hypothetical protein
MDFNTTIDIILKDLRDVREIIDDLKNYPGLPLLQVELAKSKCRSAEEVIALLKTMKQSEVIKPDSLIELAEEEEIEEKHQEAVAEPKRMTIGEKHVPQASGSSTIIADKFAAQSGTISDKFESGDRGEDLASVIKRSKPVGNLAEVIGISDKFLFIREIFKGNQSDYEQAIEKLNRAESLPDAMAVIMSYTGENAENEAVGQLLDIVKRKLPSDG